MTKEQKAATPASGRDVADKVLNERIRQARKEEVLEIYEELLQTVWDRILPTLGRVTVMAIMERAIVLTKESFPVVQRLEVTSEGLSFDSLRGSLSESELETIREALRELVADLIDILAMLTGDILVQQLIKEIDGEAQDMMELEKLSTGIPSLDEILAGGLPRNSVNVIAGPPGTGKSILAQQMVFHNSRADNHAPYLVTVSEPTVKMLRYNQRFSFFDAERVGKNVIYLDLGSTLLHGGLDEVTRQIEEYIEKYNPTLLAIDSFKALHEVAKDIPQLREFAYRLAIRLTTWGTTTLMVGEYTREAIYETPIFAIADGIFYLDNISRGMQSERYLEVLKVRGDRYFEGKHPFSIGSDGITVYPRLTTPAVLEPYPVGERRLSLGVPGLDEMTYEGVLSATSTLVAGSAGTGKTLLGLHFLLEGIRKGEPGLLVTFQETPSMLRAFSRSFGWDLEQLEAEGQLYLLYSSPVELSVDQHAQVIRECIAETGARRIVMDSLKDIELATPDKVRYKDYIYSMVNDFRRQGITSLLTAEIPEMFGHFTVSEYGVSFVTDNVILMRYVEIEGHVARALSVLKMRGSDHDKSVREFRIRPQTGIEVLQPFADYDTVLTGASITSAPPGASLLSPYPRRVLNRLMGSSGKTLEELARACGLESEFVREAVDTLLQLGYVIRQTRDGRTLYKATTG